MKKGYALASTLAVMVVVIAITTLLITLVTSMNFHQKNDKNNLERFSQVSQISQNYIDLTKENFEIYYTSLGYTKIIQNEKIIYQNNLEKYYFSITNSEPNVIFNIFLSSSDKKLVEIITANNTIISWQNF